MSATAFNGFTKEAVDFLTDLRFHNDQAFYEANRERYETTVKAPLRALCIELAPVITEIDSRLDVRPGRVMSRIRRDTRFSRDKSPFRDHVWLGWKYPGERNSDGFNMYWGFGPDWISWGCGSYQAIRPMMDALRMTILKEPDAVRAVLAPLKGRFALTGEDYKKLRIPDTVPEDLAALYRKKRFDYMQIPSEQDWQMLFSREMADRLFEDLAAMGPLVQLMQRMRAQGEAAQQRMQREQEEARRAEAGRTERPTVKAVHTADEFEF